MNRWLGRNAERCLRDLTERRICLLAVCRRCSNRTLLFPSDLAARLGPAYPVKEVMRRLACSRCGARAHQVRVDEVSR